MSPLRRFWNKFEGRPDEPETTLSALNRYQKEIKRNLTRFAQHQQQRFTQLDRSLLHLERSIERIDVNFTHQTLPERISSGMNILVAGFFGASNLGDELMLETALTTLKKTHPSARITIMLADNYSSDISRYGDYDFIHYPNTPLEINTLARHFDSIIFPGGAIIDDVEYGFWNKPLTLGTILVNLSLRFIAMNKPCVLYGLSTNTKLVNPEFVKKIDMAIAGAQHFSLRDSNSLETLKNAGVSTEKIAIVDDIVIANKLITQKNSVNNDIGLIYIYTEESLKQLIAFTQSILENTSRRTRVKLILFYDFNNNDLTFARRLVETINNSRLSIESTLLGDYAETIKQIGSMGTIFSMRYHGTLLANFLGIRVVCLDYSQHRHYSNKNRYLYSHYGFTRNIIDASTLGSISKKELSDILENKIKRINSKIIQTRANARLVRILKGIN